MKTAGVRLLLMGLVLGVLPLGVGRAAVVRMEIRQRQPFAEGHSFGRSGPYETVAGRLYFEVAPDDPAADAIADLAKAPRNAAGRIEFWSDFFLLKPLDPQRGNRRVLYDVNNRGNKLAVWTFNHARSNNPKTLADAGNGFLMREGYSVLWCGWNGDVLPGDDRLLVGLPVATDNGRPIKGKIHVEMIRDERVESQPLYWGPWGYAQVYEPVTLDTRQATLTMRPTRSQPAATIPSDGWAFARLENGKPVADPNYIWIKDGMRPGWLYDLVYTGQNPRVMGLGLAALRDCVSFFRYEAADRQQQANPLAGAVERAYVFGISQSGRAIRHFLFGGFNTDERARMVFDGAIAHVAGGGRLFAQRFGIMTTCASHHENHLSPTDTFPFTSVSQTDPATGQQGDLLARTKARGQVPKIFFTQSSSEYWSRAASLIHTDVEGTRDVEVDPNVRIYLVAGSHHLGGGPTDRGICQNLRNPLDDRGPVLRALLVAMDRWVTAGQQPPESRYPRIADKTLVDLDTFCRQFPRIPNVNLPRSVYSPYRLDFGPRWQTQGIADIIPPRLGPPYRTMVPAVDSDGNELAGIRLPDVAVPLATYAGWNLRAAAYGAEGMLAPYNGSYIPFAEKAEDRQATGDPRPSVRERYPDQATYLARMTEAARQLQKQQLLLEEDVTSILQTAAQRQHWAP
jgi:hypothetical protein